jgi:hypothetical protein
MAFASAERVRQVAGEVGRSERTIWRWARAGCDLASESSIRQFAEGAWRRRTNVQRSRERREAFVSNGSGAHGPRRPARPDLDRLLLEELPPPGRRGAAAALARLEEEEERAHARLLLAMEKGNPSQLQELQEFWLKCSESLRKLDLAVDWPGGTLKSESRRARHNS